MYSHECIAASCSKHITFANIWSEHLRMLMVKTGPLSQRLFLLIFFIQFFIIFVHNDNVKNCFHSCRVTFLITMLWLSIVTCTSLIRRVLVWMIGFINSGYTLTLNYNYTQAIQHCLSFTQFTVHCCGLLPPRISFLAISCRELIWNCCVPLYFHSLHSNWNWLHTRYITFSPTTQKTSHAAAIFETCVVSHCVATVATLTIANPLLIRYPATSSKNSFFYCCVPFQVSMASTVTAWRKHATI
jgi:hypothetical protein